MAENDDVTMGGTGVLGSVEIDTNASSGGHSRERLNASTPLPQIVSDIIRPSQLDTSGMSSSILDRSMHQAASLATGSIKQGLTLQPQTPTAPSSSRLTVLIKSSPAKSHTSFSHLSTPSFSASKMKNKASTAASNRDPRVKPEPQNATAAAALPPAAAAAHLKAEGQSPQRRPRGRPKGWKQGMAYTHGKGGPPAPGGEARRKPAPPTQQQQGGGGEPKKRGRPPRAPDATAREQYLQTNPTYTRFLCEWMEEYGQEPSSGEQTKERRCPAELQNLDTLRKHVHLIHGSDYYYYQQQQQSGGTFVCRWGKCGERASSAPRAEFPDQEAFEAHMEEAHFRSFAWHAGDGVQNQGIATLSLSLARDPDGLPDYLFQDGVQVTPSVGDQRLEDDQGRRERKRRLKQLQAQQSENAPDEEEYMLQTLGLAEAQQQNGGGRFPSFN